MPMCHKGLSTQPAGLTGKAGRCDMPKKASARQNEYRCCVETNQNGKYCVRIHARFKRHDWELPVYFLASTLKHAIHKLEQTVQFLQQHEDRLWFWGWTAATIPMSRRRCCA